jgi:putative PIN family toxin of toxin-antitoxin system
LTSSGSRARSTRPSAKSGRRGLRVVVDTNVWVSGLIAAHGAPGRVLEALRQRAFDPVVSWELAEEIAQVLRRPKLARYRIGEADIGELFALMAPFLPTVEVEISLRDPDDAPVVLTAVAGGADAIVTGVHGLLKDESLVSWLGGRGVELLDPSELLARLRLG